MSDTPMVEMMILDKRIAELEQELLEERASYEAECQRLRDALVLLNTCLDTYWNDIEVEPEYRPPYSHVNAICRAQQQAKKALEKET